MGFYVIVELCLCACLGIGDGRTSRLAAVGFASHGRSYFTSQFYFFWNFSSSVFLLLILDPIMGAGSEATPRGGLCSSVRTSP